ncbi:MAG: LysM peptidoglycan-binding domain-containing protein [bacterium]|nr:LysM peptidoglycan-binding domain-containing protein [bacterium]
MRITTYCTMLCGCLLLAACDDGIERMTAMPSEPPEPMLDPPAMMEYGAPQRTVQNPAGIVLADTVDVTVDGAAASNAPAQVAETKDTGGAGLFYRCRTDCVLTSVAARAQVEIGALARVNGLTPMAMVRSGTLLLLPRNLDNVATAPDITTYTVAAGDTYSRIARTYKISVAILMQLNKTTKDTLQIGDVLYVPKVR